MASVKCNSVGTSTSATCSSICSASSWFSWRSSICSTCSWFIQRWFRGSCFIWWCFDLWLLIPQRKNKCDDFFLHDICLNFQHVGNLAIEDRGLFWILLHCCWTSWTWSWNSTCRRRSWTPLTAPCLFCLALVGLFYIHSELPEGILCYPFIFIGYGGVAARLHLRIGKSRCPFKFVRYSGARCRAGTDRNRFLGEKKCSEGWNVVLKLQYINPTHIYVLISRTACALRQQTKIQRALPYQLGEG